ncbi:alpha/beta hydrolase [Pedobacter aquae]|uniref:Alpha/beta hydrolase n=1 Tax=Pedobacter aquae TaxID=2605747 RepID=A0A5C0VLI2_9SPHI|nr:alpha/beta hydrolase-fold protein [Pedobacter aquae]QEK51834.1 alpha/beta hydrolase [Pedobacter aquae]
MKKENFSLTGSNQHTIIGDITYSAKPTKQVAIFVHGFKGFKDWGAHHLVAQYFASYDIHYVKFNFSHSGVNPENPVDVNDLNLFAANTPSFELFDLDLIISYTKQKFPDAALTLIGHSRGGGLSILTAAENKSIHKLITWAAIDSFSSLWKKEQEPEWREKGKIEVFNARTKEYMPLNLSLLQDIEQNADKLNIKTAAENIKKPWLIIHGNDDINVPLSVAQNFLKLNHEASFIEINKANHVFGASHPYKEDQLPEQLIKVCDASIDFIKKTE